MLKKKYRQQLQEKEAKHPRMDGEGQRHPSPAKTAAAAAQWDAGTGPTRCLQQDEPMSCAAEVNSQTATSSVNRKKTNKQTVRRADGMTQRPDVPSAPAQHSCSLCCVTHLSVNKAASVRCCVSAEDPGGQCCQSGQVLFMPGRRAS